MDIKNNKLHLFLFIVIIGLSSNIFASSVLKTLNTKQAINSLRYISSDGNFTYYQRRSGGLFLSTNYNVKPLIKSTKFSHYFITSSKNNIKMIIGVLPHYQSYYNLREKAQLYQVNYGKLNPQKIGKGISPVLHLNDEWCSYYDPYNRILRFQNLNYPEMRFKIDLINKINFYFIPQVIMLDKENIIYTDLDKNGKTAIVHFFIPQRKFKTLKKTNSHLVKIELCADKSNLYIGTFGLSNVHKHSTISKMNIKRYKNFSKQENIYSSDYNDIGNITCDLQDQQIYFIKSKLGENKRINFDAYKLNPKNKELIRMSDLLYVTQIIKMDKRLLVPFRGQYYLLVGKNVEIDDSFLGM